MNTPFISVIVPAAGSGNRMKSDIKKQFLELQGHPILFHTLSVFQKCEEISEIIVVCPNELCSFVSKEITYTLDKVKTVVPGGKERQDSVLCGLQHVSEQADVILVHDGVRPFIRPNEIKKLCTELENHDAAVIAVPVKNTIKVVQDKFVEHTPDRSSLWAIQTPQGMKADIFRKCYAQLANDSILGTDESSIAEHYGYQVKVIEGDYKNIKITTPEDLEIGELFLREGNK